MAFTYKGITSRDMHLRVENELELSSTERDIELIEIPGRDGDLVLDNGRFKSVVKTFPCILVPPPKKDVESLVHPIHQWLACDVGYHDLLLEDDREFVYQGIIDNPVTTNKILSHLGKTVISFRLHPIKYLKTSLIEEPLTNGMTLTNPFGIEAKPMIRMIGNGNMTLTIGGRELVLQGIAGGCLIDSDTHTIMSLDGRVTLFERMFSPFPILKPGNNVINFPTHIQVFITPRLGALV